MQNPPSFSISQVDAVEWLRTLPTESIDLIITDPPYESLEKHRAIGTTIRLKKSKASSNEWLNEVASRQLSRKWAEVKVMGLRQMGSADQP